METVFPNDSSLFQQAADMDQEEEQGFSVLTWPTDLNQIKGFSGQKSLIHGGPTWQLQDLEDAAYITFRDLVESTAQRVSSWAYSTSGMADLRMLPLPSQLCQAPPEIDHLWGKARSASC